MNIPAKDKELIEEYMMPYGQLLIRWTEKD